ncbi:30S ribosome-binding factor RbfA [Methylogaea oryzae]|uniref:Ribosome-binding factor A n=1 Tax=Methylogaea oryzae TaxID=1295382 RepID=A0A8D5AJD6_9GAMM|nr:30S ribosome-binding factor RbfA [Methylogaea oryzae]BBL70679.1 ribosome-binding factor A [Methylogaea oryzae]
MPREFTRSDRVGSQMHRELAELLRTEVKDPRVGMVSIHEVEVTRDLSVAKVYVGLMLGGAEEARASVAALNRAASFLRKELGRRMLLRSVPEIRFIYDDSVERGARISQLLGGFAAKPDESADAEE